MAMSKILRDLILWTATFSCILSVCTGYESFQQKVPNGDRVPHPFKENYVWHGVGHKMAEGGGERNPFGVDLARNSYIWDECLCKMDSDEDGKTNGEELGDPDCVWSEGKPPKYNIGLSHPGICEPVNTTECIEKNKVSYLETEEFNCPATQAEGVITLDLTFPETEVPAKVTNYFCHYMKFNLEEGKTYHLIANEPIIDNKDIMHHTIVYGCRDDDIEEIEKTYDGTPKECSRMGCTEMFALWTVGSNGICLPDIYGAIVGEGGIKAVFMQHHWNNYDARSGRTDASGMRFYLTETLRPQNFTYSLVGPMTLEIPVGAKDHTESGGCLSHCTDSDLFPETLYITTMIPHMHYYGRKMVVHHIRPGIFEKLLFEENNFKYDTPVEYENVPAIEFKRGDSLIVNCTFTTTSATSPTYWGQGTYDEMCLVAITIYPAIPELPSICMSSGDVAICSRQSHYDLGGCDINALRKNPLFFKDVHQKCDPLGLTCKVACQDALNALESNECFSVPNNRKIVTNSLSRSKKFRTVANMLVSCTKPQIPSYTINNTPKNATKQENILCKKEDKSKEIDVKSGCENKLSFLSPLVMVFIATAINIISHF